MSRSPDGPDTLAGAYEETPQQKLSGDPGVSSGYARVLRRLGPGFRQAGPARLGAAGYGASRSHQRVRRRTRTATMRMSAAVTQSP